MSTMAWAHSSKAGDAASKPRARKVKPPLDEAGLMELALRSLTAQMKSERDLRRKLTLRAEPGEPGQQAIGAVLARLKELNYLSDERFAADFTRMRQENEKYGRRRVQQGLMQKGIRTDLAQSTLAAAYDDLDEAKLARQYIERKRLKKPEDQKETARVMRRLLAAGFSSRAIWKVLRDWGTDIDEVAIEASEMDEVGDA
jgi:regulatory protein